jgi:hypothetical protein
VKIKNDFVKRTEKAIVLLEEGNLARVEQEDVIFNGPLRRKRPKICSTCVYAKVLLFKYSNSHQEHIIAEYVIAVFLRWIITVLGSVLLPSKLIANCVGFKNYKFFLMLLIYSAICLLFIAFTYWEEVILVVSNNTVKV